MRSEKWKFNGFPDLGVKTARGCRTFSAILLAKVDFHGGLVGAFNLWWLLAKIDKNVLGCLFKIFFRRY